MDWQALMAALEKWLWQSPYLDVSNYAWIASGLALLVLLFYLVLAAWPKKTAEKAPVKKAADAPQTAPDQAALAAQAPGQTTPRTSPAGAFPAPGQAAQETAPEAPGEEAELTPPEGWFARLRAGLSKTQDKLTNGIERLTARAQISDELMEQLEELLITSDLGVQTSIKLLERLQAAVKEERIKQAADIRQWMKNDIKNILAEVEKPLRVPEGHKGPFVIMVTGVNGTGKTTTIGKLALRFAQEGKSVVLGAADTFRAAAISQLAIWAERAGCRIIAHQEGADPSAVAFDTIKAAQARGMDVAIIDTAGRLHTKVNLMEEVKKIKRIVGRELPGAPHEIMLVLDATTGQNAVAQARLFHQALGISGIALTKLDGTAKGGIIVAISDEFKIPIRFIGVGEKIYDLQPFKASEFVDAIF